MFYFHCSNSMPRKNLPPSRKTNARKFPEHAREEDPETTPSHTERCPGAWRFERLCARKREWDPKEVS
ncbi:hypothetical protein VTN02DRAFT_3952 [Thermoascus thermophilus]